jgi:hypothetical protein
MSCHQPAYKSCTPRLGTNTADDHREYPVTIVNTGNCLAVRSYLNPTGTTMSGNQKSQCAISPGL